MAPKKQGQRVSRPRTTKATSVSPPAMLKASISDNGKLTCELVSKSPDATVWLVYQLQPELERLRRLAAKELA